MRVAIRYRGDTVIGYTAVSEDAALDAQLAADPELVEVAPDHEATYTPTDWRVVIQDGRAQLARRPT